MALSHSGIPKNAALRAGYSHFQSARRRIQTATTENLIQIPSYYFPHSGYTGALWIEFQPSELSAINTGGRGGTFRTGKQGPVYRFLAPAEGVNETHNHDWQVYENMFAKLLDIYSKTTEGIKKSKQFVTGVTNQAKRALNEGELGSASEVALNLIAATAFDKAKKRIDSPLAYETSPRRQFIFTFPLISEGLTTKLVEIVKDIQGYAAAKTPDNTSSIEIGWPHVWSIQSEPRGVLDVDLAACTSVQVDWMDPYIGGVPQRCNLTLGFTDISPLFAQTIKYGSLVNVNPQSKEIEEKTYSEHLKDKGTLPGEIKSMVQNVRERMGAPKTNTPINP